MVDRTGRSTDKPTPPDRSCSTMQRRGRSLLLSTAFASLAAAAVGPETAHAAGECGPTRQGDVVCTGGGNPYSGGIAYTSAAIDPSKDPAADATIPVYDLTVRVGADVVVERDGGGAGVALSGVNGGGVTLVSNGSILTSGDYGVGALTRVAAGGSAAVSVGDVSTDGFASHGVYAVADAVGVSIDGTISTSYAFSNGVRALASNGGVVVTNNGVIDTSGGGGVGIVAYGSAGATVSGGGTIHTRGSASSGIGANGFDGATSVSASSVITEGDFSRGVVAEGSGDVSVDVGNVVTSGQVASGIEAETVQGGSGPLDADLQVRAGNVTVAGAGANGISVFSSNNGVIRIGAGGVTARGEGGVGILSESYTADTFIDVDDVVTTGSGTEIVANRPTGIRVTSDTGDIAISSSGLISTQGSFGFGISAATNGVVEIDVHDVSTRGDAATAIDAVGGSSGVTISGMVSTAGVNAAGVYASGRTGTAAITNDGLISVTGSGSRGIVALATGDVTVSGTGSVRSGNVALDLRSEAGTVAVSQAGIVTTGDHAHGIAASAGRDVIIDVGSVRTSGLSSDAVRASAVGAADLRVAGSVRSDTSVGVAMVAGGPAHLTTGPRSSVTGGTDAVLIDSGRGATIDNAGTISGGSGYALRVTGGPATITNTGAIVGRLRLTGGDDVLNNGGRLTLTGASDFGVGADRLANSGVIELRASAQVQTASITGLETLANSGAIDLRNGVAGDRLILDGTAYSGDGAASLGLDVAFAPGRVTADQIVLGFVVGVTAIKLDVTGTPTLFAPMTLVEVQTGSSPSALTLVGGTRDFGLIAIGLSYAPAAGYQLVSAPGASVHRQARLGEALTSLWNRSGDAISAHLSSDRDAAWIGQAHSGSGRLWLQTLGEVDTRRDRRDVDLRGLVQSGVDVGYRQDAFGAQIGLDVIGDAGSGGAIVGVTGGYLNSTTRFTAGGGDRFDIDALNVGAYAGFRGGAFFVNGLGKVDFYSVDRRSPVAGLDREDRTHAWGGKVETGFRLGSGRLFAEPVVSVAYSQASLGRFTVDDAAFDYDRSEGLRGRAGLRVGGHADVEGAVIGFYAVGTAVRELAGDDRLRFSSGGQVVVLDTDRLDTFGQGAIGVNVAMQSGVTGFIEAHGEAGSEYRGGGGRAGLRVSF